MRDGERPPPGDEQNPLDQLGFEELQPAPDHPAAEKEEEDETSPEDQMGLLDHLDELRSVLIHSSIAAFLATVLCWFVSAKLLNLLILPIREEGVYFTAPNEAFITRLKLSAAVGMFVVAPFIFFKIYGFILPGLYRKERKVVTPLLLATTTGTSNEASMSCLVTWSSVTCPCDSNIARGANTASPRSRPLSACTTSRPVNRPETVTVSPRKSFVTGTVVMSRPALCWSSRQILARVGAMSVPQTRAPLPLTRERAHSLPSVSHSSSNCRTRPMPFSS